MFVPPVRSVVAHTAFMSPAMSSVPWVDRDSDLVFDKTALMPDSCLALSDLSLALACAVSPIVADNIAPTSWADLSIT